MKKLLCAATMLLLLVALPAAAADISGQYRVEGSNPGGGGGYSGVVTVRQTGETWNVVWRIGSQVFEGYGILDRDTLSVSYNGGLAVYEMSGNGARGIWTPDGGTELGREDWSR